MTRSGRVFWTVAAAALGVVLAGCEAEKVGTDSGAGADGAGDGAGGDGAGGDGGDGGGGDGADGADGGPVDEDSDGATADVDCDDADPSSYPGAVELCDTVDNDCDGEIDEDAPDAPLWYGDADRDGFGDPDSGVASCAPPPDTAAEAGDCDDGDPAIFPGAEERCDAVDSDCDGSLDDPESVDATSFFADDDDDGFGDPAEGQTACAAPAGTVANDQDCDDGDEFTSPDGAEVCDGRDNDCDALIDDADDSLDLLTRTTFYDDADLDGYGDPDAAFAACSAPAGAVAAAGDCDDGDGAINPGAVDLPQDGLDQDCDGADDPYLVSDLLPGDLVISEFMQNPAAVADAVGEWFEVYNNSGGVVDLDGLYVYDLGSERFTVAGSLLVEPGDYVVFAFDANEAVNGGVPTDYDFASFTLGNSDDEIGLAESSAKAVIFDEVLWDNGLTMPDGNGQSASLDPAALDATLNDVGANWCLTATRSFGAGDRGTPGAENEACSG